MTFSPRIVYGDTDLTDAPYGVDFDFDLGHGVTLYDVAESLLLDGAIMVSPGAGNREGLVIPVYIEASDTQIAADYGTTLDLEASKRSNTLAFYPGDGYGPATVLETFPAQITPDWNQDLEQAGLRRVLLTIPALPFGRSVDEETFTWTGPGDELDPLTSAATWTLVAGDPVTVVADTDEGTNSALRFPTGGATIEQEFATPLQEYLWLKTNSVFVAGESVSINGVVVPTTEWGTLANAGGRYIAAIPTGDAAGSTATVRIVGNATRDIMELYTVGYPGKPVGGTVTKPNGIGMVDIAGSARTMCSISFTAPADGAFVYTAPDPNAAIRERGVAEVLFAHFEVTDPDGGEVSIGSQLMWFPEGTHSAQIGATEPQPLSLAGASGVWPTQFSGAWSPGGSVAGFKFAYPADSRAAVTFYDTSGAKNVISATVDLRSGYHGSAPWHEPPALHAGRCGFAVLDKDGKPITATVTYYPRWWSYAGQ